MDQTPAHDTQEFLAGVADQIDAAAARMEQANGAVDPEVKCESTQHFTANFGSKLVYTACYTLSYGICFPIFAACRYVPRNNEFVTGLVDGGKSANRAVDEMMGRAEQWRLARRDAAEQAAETDEILENGAEALAPA